VAREHFLTDDDAVAWIQERGGIDGEELISTMFGGIQVVRLLRREVADLPICLLSNYTRHAAAVDIINHVMRRELPNLIILEKSEADYDELRKWAMALYGDADSRTAAGDR
jgi:hypothetical protein